MSSVNASGGRAESRPTVRVIVPTTDGSETDTTHPLATVYRRIPPMFQQGPTWATGRSRWQIGQVGSALPSTRENE